MDTHSVAQWSAESKSLDRPTLRELYERAREMSANDLSVDDILGDKQWTDCRIEKVGDRYRLIGHRDYWDGRISKTPSVIAEGTADTRVPAEVTIAKTWHHAWYYNPDLVPPPCFAEVDEFIPIRRARSSRPDASVSAGTVETNADTAPSQRKRRASCSSRCQTSTAPVSTCRCACGGKTHGIRADRKP